MSLKRVAHTHHFVLGNVEDLLLDDLGLVLRQEVKYGLRVGGGLDEWVLKIRDGGIL